LSLAFDLNFQMLGLNRNNQLLWCCALGQEHLNVDILDGLWPVIFRSFVTVVCADWFVDYLEWLLLLWGRLLNFLRSFFDFDDRRLILRFLIRFCLFCLFGEFGVLLEFVPTLLKCLTFGREFFLVFFLMFLVELVDLKKGITFRLNLWLTSPSANFGGKPILSPGSAS
jgi:hypothetical protein